MWKVFELGSFWYGNMFWIQREYILIPRGNSSSIFLAFLPLTAYSQLQSIYSLKKGLLFIECQPFFLTYISFFSLFPTFFGLSWSSKIISDIDLELCGVQRGEKMWINFHSWPAEGFCVLNEMCTQIKIERNRLKVHWAPLSTDKLERIINFHTEICSLLFGSS